MMGRAGMAKAPLPASHPTRRLSRRPNLPRPLRLLALWCFFVFFGAKSLGTFISGNHTEMSVLRNLRDAGSTLPRLARRLG